MRCFNFDISMMYLSLRLFICLISYFKGKFSILIWRAPMCNCEKVSPLPRRKDITRSWDLVWSPHSWGLIANTTAIIRSNQFSLFMYIMSLTCYFGSFDEVMVSSLTMWTLSAPENDLWFYFTVENLGCVSSGRRKKDMLWCYALIDFYAVQLLFVDKYCKKAEIMASHNFWIWRMVSPLRVMEDICLVNYNAWEYLSGELRSGHLIISAEGWS